MLLVKHITLDGYISIIMSTHKYGKDNNCTLHSIQLLTVHQWVVEEHVSFLFGND